MTSFTEDMRRRGMVPASRTLDIHVAPAGAHLGRLLHVSPSEPVVIISRLRLADHETMAIETLHVRESLVPGISAADLEQQSFYELLEGRYGITIVGGLQTIEPTVTNEEESEALGVPLHSPAFVFERTTRSGSGEIVEYVRSIYRGDRYRLVTELNRRSLGRAGNGSSDTTSSRWSVPIRPSHATGRSLGSRDVARAGESLETARKAVAKRVADPSQSGLDKIPRAVPVFRTVAKWYTPVGGSGIVVPAGHRAHRTIAAASRSAWGIRS